MTVLNRRNHHCHVIVTVTVTEETPYLRGFLAGVTVMTLMTLIYGLILDEGMRRYFLGSLTPLNAWCELSLEDLSGRCPRTRVGLLTNPEGKGTDSSWLTWTPSSPHFTSWSTIFASLIEPYEADPVLMPPSVVVRSSPSLSSLGGRGSPAKGTSTATPRHICEQHSLPFQTVPSSTGSCDSMLRTSRRSP